MSAPNYTPEQQQEIQRYSQYIQQLEILRSQIQQLEIEKREILNGQKETKDLNESAQIFRSAGNLLYETDLESVGKYLEERKEKVEVRLESLRSREKKLISKVENIQKKFQPSSPS